MGVALPTAQPLPLHDAAVDTAGRHQHVVGYLATDNRSHANNDQDASVPNLSSELSRFICDQDMDSYKAIIKQEHQEKERRVEMQPERALV